MLKIILFVFLINFQSIYSFVLPGKIDFHFNKVKREIEGERDTNLLTLYLLIGTLYFCRD
jgi:hypothetical protein